MVFATQHGHPKFPGTIFGHIRFFFRAHYQAHFRPNFRAHFRAHHMCILAHDVAHYDGKGCRLGGRRIIGAREKFACKKASNPLNMYGARLAFAVLRNQELRFQLNFYGIYGGGGRSPPRHPADSELFGQMYEARLVLALLRNQELRLRLNFYRIRRDQCPDPFK